MARIQLSKLAVREELFDIRYVPLFDVPVGRERRSSSQRREVVRDKCHYLRALSAFHKQSFALP